jgi:hypothetical protein
VSKRTITVFAIIIVVGAVAGGLAWYYATPAPFTMQVTSRPTSPPGAANIITSISGQRCVFLVVVEEDEGWLQGLHGQGEAVDISATDPNRKANAAVYPKSITPGQVAEVTVTPTVASSNETFTVTITGERQGLAQTEEVTIEVIPGEDDLAEYASEMRGMFVPWLAINHPELGITDETEWTGTIVNPEILVVMHYIFFSEEWEMYVTWHVTIPPHDWTRIYLRRRFTELRPSHAFEISSVKGKEEPQPMEVPPWV